MSEVPAIPPLVDGEYPVKYTDEDYDKMERARLDAALTATERHVEISSRLEAVERDLSKVLDVISQLETFLANVMPAVDQITANPAKFIMSLMAGGKGGR